MLAERKANWLNETPLLQPATEARDELCERLKAVKEEQRVSGDAAREVILLTFLGN